MKIAVFSGAGISRESGIDTFRDLKDGLWMNHKVEEVATSEGFKKNPSLVLEFHNKLRAQMHDKLPNSAHIALAELEKEHEVTIITQNVDNLHERAGSTNILHLHGELFKCRSVNDHAAKNLIEVKGDLNLGDKDDNGYQLRPHTVLFNEMPYNVDEAYKAIRGCDVLLIVGTSLPISYTIPMLLSVNEKAKIVYLDPAPARDLEYYEMNVHYIVKPATEGMVEFVELVKKIENNV